MLIRDLRHHSSPRLRLSSVAALFFQARGSQLPLWGCDHDHRPTDCCGVALSWRFARRGRRFVVDNEFLWHRVLYDLDALLSPI